MARAVARVAEPEGAPLGVIDLTTRSVPRCIAGLVGLVLAGCAMSPAPAPAGSSASPRAPAHPPATSATSASGVASSASPRAGGLSSCAPARRLADLPVFATPGLSPDDLLALPDGTVWVTDPVGGAVAHVGAHGELLSKTANREAPEGMIALPDGRLLLAEQRTNQIATFQPASGATSTFHSLPDRGPAEGVDGLGLDIAGGRILVPDSAHGTLLSVPLGGGPATLLARGMGRDVAAAIGPDSQIWVAVEGPHGLLRIPAGGGAAEPVGAVSQLDDIVAAGGLLYATVVTAGQVVAVDPATGALRVLVTGIGSAQGLALLPDGRIIVADSSSRAIAVVNPCS